MAMRSTFTVASILFRPDLISLSCSGPLKWYPFCCLLSIWIQHYEQVMGPPVKCQNPWVPNTLPHQYTHPHIGLFLSFSSVHRGPSDLTLDFLLLGHESCVVIKATTPQRRLHTNRTQTMANDLAVNHKPLLSPLSLKQMENEAHPCHMDCVATRQRCSKQVDQKGGAQSYVITETECTMVLCKCLCS